MTTALNHLHDDDYDYDYDDAYYHACYDEDAFHSSAR